MTTKNIFKYLLAGVLLMGSTNNAMAQTFVPGTTAKTNYWRWQWTENKDTWYVVTGSDGDDKGDYNVTQNSSVAGNLTDTHTIASFSGNISGNARTAALQEIKYQIEVPSYSSVSCSYNFTASINKESGNNAFGACELMYFGKNTFTNQYVYTDGSTNSSVSRLTTSGVESCIRIAANGTGTKTASTSTPYVITINNFTGTESTETRYFYAFSYWRVPDLNWVQWWNPYEDYTNRTASISYSDATITYSYYNRIHYNLNGGTGLDYSDWATSNTVDNTPTKSGYGFAGWKDANGNDVLLGTVYTATADNKGTIELYAQWRDPRTSITFNPNGGTLSEANADFIITSGSTSHNTTTVAIQDGYNFEGWYTSDNKQVYDADGNAVEGYYWTKSGNAYSWKISDDLDLVLIAKWSASSGSSAEGNTVSISTVNGVKLYAIESSRATAWRHEQMPLTLQLYSNIDESGTPNTPVDRFVNGINDSQETEKLSVYASSRETIYMKLSLPRGYRILGYKMGVTRKKNDNSEEEQDANITRYLNNFSDASDHQTFTKSTWLTTNGGIDESFTNAHNTLCFKFSDGNNEAYYLIDNFTVTYAVDDEFTEELPTVKGNSMINTGVVDFGEFSGTTPVYSKANVTDKQQAEVYCLNEGVKSYLTNCSVVNGSTKKFYRISANGDYYVEAPKGYRIIGAKATCYGSFLVTPGDVYPSDTDVKGGEVSANLFDGNSDTKWCTIFTSSSKPYVEFKTSVSTAMTGYQFVDAYDTYHENPDKGSAYTYKWRHWTGWTIYGWNDGQNYESNDPISSESDDTSEDYTTTLTNIPAYTHYRVAINGVGVPKTGSEGYGVYRQQMADMNFMFTVTDEESVKYSYNIYTYHGAGSSYTETTVNGLKNATLVNFTNPSNNGEYTTLLNNDAVKFTIAKLTNVECALVNIELTLIPLDPHIQSVEIHANGTSSSGNSLNNVVKSSASDYEIENADIVIPSEPAYQAGTYNIVFTNAKNNKVISSGNSNYYLMGGNFYNTTTGSGLPSGDRTTPESDYISTDMASTSKVEFTNLATLSDGSVLADYDYSTICGNVNPSAVTATKNVEQNVYLYVADIPLYNISSTPHVACRCYKASVNVHESEITPLVNVTTIYNNDIVKTDKNEGLIDDYAGNKYVGVKVGYTVVSSKMSITDGKGNYLSTEAQGQALQNIKEADIGPNTLADWHVVKTVNFGQEYFQIYYVKEGLKYYLLGYPFGGGNLGFTTDDSNMFTRWLTNKKGQVFQCTKNGQWYYTTESSADGVGYFNLHCNGGNWNGETASAVNPQYVIMFNGVDFITGEVGVSSADIISNVKTEVAKTTTNDAILYVDMSELGNITENIGVDDWNTFQQEVADNALFFLPANCTGSFTKNAIVKNTSGSGYTSSQDFVLTDKQPFFSPYNFKTGGYYAMYTRLTTGGYSDENVKQSTLMLPFRVKVTNGTSNKVEYADGSDGCDGITFRTLGAITLDTETAEPNDYKVTPAALADNINYTTANQAYHITINGDNKLYSVKERDAYVAATPTSPVNGISEWLMDGSIWTAHSSYCGESFNKIVPQSLGKKMYYYSAGKYWCSETLSSSNTIRLYPFRAVFYIDSSVAPAAGAKTIRISFDDEGESAGIEESVVDTNVSVDNGIYTISGVKLNRVPEYHGIYIVNGKKVLY